jgi:hypothetical protein
LEVEVNHQSTQTLTGADGGQVAGDGGLSYAPFLIENDERHDAIPCADGR